MCHLHHSVITGNYSKINKNFTNKNTERQMQNLTRYNYETIGRKIMNLAVSVSLFNIVSTYNIRIVIMLM
jgi:hypothetical protein